MDKIKVRKGRNTRPSATHRDRTKYRRNRKHRNRDVATAGVLVVLDIGLIAVAAWAAS